MKTRINAFLQKHVYLFNVGLIMLTFIGLLLLSALINEETLVSLGSDGCKALQRILLSSLLIGLMAIIGIFNKEEFKTKGFLRGVALQWLLIIGCIINFYDSYSVLDATHLKPVSVGMILLFSFHMLSIGLFEEVLMRGVVFNNMARKWGGSKGGIYKAAIISSLLFGMLHLINLLQHPNLIVATWSQVIYATFIGIFFCGVYWRSRNMWSIILLHGLFDFSADILTLFSEQVVHYQMQDISITDGIVNVLMMAVFAIMGLFLLHQGEGKDRA